ncbi:MAG: ribulokinase, partial [Mesorhizobium sp.]
MTKSFVCAVDVGTGSARAGILDAEGNLLARADHPIAMHQPKPDHAEHDSEDIWSAVCKSVRSALEKSGVAAGDIAGISFDATCSLVARDRQG